MRILSKFETEVITHLCSVKDISKDVAICDIITHFCPCSLMWDENSITVFFDTNKYQKDYVLNRLMSIICLFEYLQTQSLIYIFKRNNVEDRKELINVGLNHAKCGNNIIEKREITVEGNPTLTVGGKNYIFENKTTGFSPLSNVNIPWNFTQLVDRYANSVVFCTETLRHIKNQGFKDDATVQYEDNRCQTWIAIIVSFFVGIAGIIGNFITYDQSEKHHCENISQVKQYIVVHDTIPQLAHEDTFQPMNLLSRRETTHLYTNLIPPDSLKSHPTDTLNLCVQNQ